MEKIYLDSEEAGDEPFMLAKNLKGAVVITHKNRVKAGCLPLKSLGLTH